MSHFENIIIIILSNISIGAIIKYLINRSVNYKFKALEHDHIAKLTEEFRIKAKVFDDRYLAYKKLIHDIAVAFEKCKSMNIFAHNGWLLDFYAYSSDMYKIKESITAILTDHRIVLEPKVIELSTEAMKTINSLANMYRSPEDQLPEYSQINDKTLNLLKKHLQTLEQIDSDLVEFTHAMIM
ncbi:MAG: hypothetical protein JW913_12285 [Chitinispirillaceae bacterium]|nr:hypothetical protein [Chitinispirillaceae bacterium]